MKHENFYYALCLILVFFVSTTRIQKSAERIQSLSLSMSKSTMKSLLEENKVMFQNSKGKNFKNMFSFKSRISNTKNANNLKLEAFLSKLDLKTPCVVEEDRCPNILTGWLKFLEITEVLPKVPNSFVKNKQFYLQQAENQGMNTMVKDHYGYFNIPNENYFYFELNKKQLKIFTARTPKYRKIDRFLNLSDLIGETSMNPCKGGVEDVGNFAEGYCFMLKFTHFSRFFVWELCADNSLDKDKWMTTLAKLNEQNKKGSMHTPSPAPYTPSQSTSSQSASSPMHHVTPAVTVVPAVPAIPAVPLIPAATFSTIPPGGSVPVTGVAPAGVAAVPGTAVSNTLVTSTGNALTIATTHGPGWIPNGPWSPCSEPCGPGIQKRHLKCIKDDGCDGADQEEKLCKLKDCKKDLEDHLKKLNMVADCGKWKLLGEWGPCSKPCGGGVQFRKRECVPANLPCVGKAEITQPCNMLACKPSEVDCKQIEGQLDMILEMGKKPVPVHLIININEVMISQEPLLAPLANIPLNSITNLQKLSANPGCFSMNNGQNHKSFNLCPHQRELTECEKWMQKIQNFKENCNNKILDKITSDIEKCNDPNKKLELINQKAMEAEKEKTANKLLSLDNKFKDFKRQVNEVLDKEDSYENGLEEQEKIKECKEDKATKDLIKKQQDAANMLLNDLSNIHKTNHEYELREKAIKRQMKQMMDDVKKKIQEKRGKLVSKMQRMKTLHDLEQKKAAHQLLELKLDLGKKMGNLSKKGNPEVCFHINDLAGINSYCDMNYKPADMNMDCKDPKKFCYLCCDHEIGALDHENLECCYNRCESVNAKLAAMTNTKCGGFLELYHLPSIMSVGSATKCSNGHCNN